MARIVDRPNGHHWIQYTRSDGKRPTVRLGKCTLKTAKAINEKIDRILEAKALHLPVDRDTARWIRRLDDTLHDRMSATGLIKPRPKTTVGDLAKYFLEHKRGKPRTIKKYENACENLIEFFTAKRRLTSIKPGDADEFRDFLLTKAHRVKEDTGLAPRTAQKRLRNATAIFKAARRKGWIRRNPFRDTRITNAPRIRDRTHFVDTKETYKVLDGCRDWQFKLLVALVRFGGLRCPSEPELFRWSWIDWEHDEITFRSPKTEHIPGRDWRTIPIFKELRPYLEEAWEAAGEGCDDLVFAELPNTSAALAGRLKRVCKRVGVEPWPKPFQNMRSTRETEVEQQFGLKCACVWIGNTEEVAKRDYLQVTKEHHARAVADGAGAKRPPKRRSKRRSR